MGMKILLDIGIIVLVPVIRSVGGWAVKALEDKKVTKFELKELAATVIRVGIIGVAGFVSLTGFGIDVPIFAAMAGAILADKLFGAIKG